VINLIVRYFDKAGPFAIRTRKATGLIIKEKMLTGRNWSGRLGFGTFSLGKRMHALLKCA
jgi:hypothetical protein